MANSERGAPQALEGNLSARVWGPQTGLGAVGPTEEGCWGLTGVLQAGGVGTERIPSGWQTPNAQGQSRSHPWLYPPPGFVLPAVGPCPGWGGAAWGGCPAHGGAP